MFSAYLKKKFEIDNNSNFDLCIRMRWDTMFDEDWVLPNPIEDTLQVIHLEFDQSLLRVWC